MRRRRPFWTTARHARSRCPASTTRPMPPALVLSVAVGHAVAGAFDFSTPPLQRPADNPQRWYTRPAPTLGEHTEEILRQLLGSSDAETAQLRADGIIGARPAGL